MRVPDSARCISGMERSGATAFTSLRTTRSVVKQSQWFGNGSVISKLKNCFVAMLLAMTIVAGFPSAFGQALASKETIAFTRFTNGYWQIWLKEEGGEARQVTNSSFDKRTPMWSPDRKKILYRSANRELYLYDLEDKKEGRILSELGAVTDPVFFPDSKRIIVSRFDPNLKDESDLWISGLTGDTRAVLTRSPGLEYGADLSPDGREVIYVAGKGFGGHDLYLMDLETRKVTRLTQSEALERSPKFSPDGRLIVFASNESGNFDLYVMDRYARKRKQLTSWPGVELSPVWSGDGTEIAFASDRSGTLQIWLMDRSGKNLRPLSEGKESAQEPAWK